MIHVHKIFTYFIIAILLGVVSLLFGFPNFSKAQSPPIPTPTPVKWPPLVATPALSLQEPPTLTQEIQPNDITIASAREYLQVPFTVPGSIGVETIQEYSGIVNVSVSGGGQSAGIAINDAFYIYIDQTPQYITPAYVEPFHLYIDNAPAIDMIGSLPQYRTDHIYTFNIDAGSTPRRLNFAIGDLYAVDNDGSFTIALSDSESFSLSDSDEDGIWDHWESQGGGIDADGDGTIDLDLYAMGARPDRKDIFLEIDWLDEGNGHSHRPTQEAINIVQNAFSSHNIELHVEFSTAIPATSSTRNVDFCGLRPNDSCPTGVTDFDNIKSNHFGNAGENQTVKDARALVYHYVLFVHRLCPSCDTSGIGEVIGNDFIVALICSEGDSSSCWAGNWRQPRSRVEAGTLMHELGHNLGLSHGGALDNPYNFKPNYLSIMNYHFQFSGIPTAGGDWIYDYSNEVLPDLNEYNLDETSGIGDENKRTFYTCDFFGGFITNITGPVQGKPINWNCLFGSNQQSVSTNINHVQLLGIGSDIYNDNDSNDPDGPDGDGLVRLKGFNDWANLQFKFRDTWEWLEGYHLNQPSEPELDSSTVQMLIPSQIFLPIILK